MHQSRLIWLVVARAGAWAPAPLTRRRLAACQSEAGLDAADGAAPSPPRAVATRRGLVGSAFAATLVEPARADDVFPGTAEERRRAVAARIKELGVRAFAEPWPETRRNLLYAGGLKDAPQTRLAFSDANHCDLTRMAARAAMSAARAFRRDFSIPAVVGYVPPSTRRAVRSISVSVVTASRRSASVAPESLQSVIP